jgi:hypothetical protein
MALWPWIFPMGRIFRVACFTDFFLGKELNDEHLFGAVFSAEQSFADFRNALRI